MKMTIGEEGIVAIDKFIQRGVLLMERAWMRHFVAYILGLVGLIFAGVTWTDLGWLQVMALTVFLGTLVLFVMCLVGPLAQHKRVRTAMAVYASSGLCYAGALFLASRPEAARSWYSLSPIILGLIINLIAVRLSRRARRKETTLEEY